jgi:hypothetical protein
MTDWQSLCAELADNLGAIAPLVYSVASDDQEEADTAAYLNQLVRRAHQALELDAKAD